jgi:hypothetical protein
MALEYPPSRPAKGMLLPLQSIAMPRDSRGKITTPKKIEMAEPKAAEVMLRVCQRRIHNRTWERLLTSCTWTTSPSNVS